MRKQTQSTLVIDHRKIVPLEELIGVRRTNGEVTVHPIVGNACENCVPRMGK